jgi:ribosomal protein S27E
MNQLKFAILQNQFIDQLLKESGSDSDFISLLCKKKIASLASLLSAKRECKRIEKEIKEKEDQKVLFVFISRLPEELKRLIGSYSPHVRTQKSLVRIEYYDNWFHYNKLRIIGLLKNWSKTKLGFVLDKIRSLNNPYYNCFQLGTSEYKKNTALMIRSRIECLIEEKGKRSNMEQYSLLLAIEKYDNKTKTKGKFTIIYCHKCAKEIDKEYSNATFCPICAAVLLSWQPSSAEII